MSVLVGVISALLIIALVVILVLRLQHSNNSERRKHNKSINGNGCDHRGSLSGPTLSDKGGKDTRYYRQAQPFDKIFLRRQPNFEARLQCRGMWQRWKESRYHSTASWNWRSGRIWKEASTCFYYWNITISESTASCTYNWNRVHWLLHFKKWYASARNNFTAKGSVDLFDQSEI